MELFGGMKRLKIIRNKRINLMKFSEINLNFRKSKFALLWFKFTNAKKLRINKKKPKSKKGEILYPNIS